MAIDVIDDFLQRLAAHLPAAQPLAPQLEAELRQHWGGTEPYIRHRPAAARRTQALGQALQQGQPLQQAFVTAGLPRRSGFRHLAKPVRR
ncbi:MAG: hypothetical protein ACK4F7_00475 [Inhella sp.]